MYACEAVAKNSAFVDRLIESGADGVNPKYIVNEQHPS